MLYSEMRLYTILIILSITSNMISATEISADDPSEVDQCGFQEAILKRLERLERKYDNEKRQWLKEKQDWQRQKEQLQYEVVSLRHKVDVLESAADGHKGNPPQTSVDTNSQFSHADASAETPSKSVNHSVLPRSEDDTNALQPVVSEMNQRLTEVEAEVQAMKSANTQQELAIDAAATSVYVHWGSSTCPSFTETIYSGVAGGGWWNSVGSTTTAFCLPHHPVLLNSSHPSEYDYLYGSEYQTEGNHYQEDSLCAVCRTPRPTTIMVPATNVCENGWTLEYNGYLMGSNPVDQSGHEAVCMDSALESRGPGSAANENGYLFYLMFTRCGSLPCPPYQNDMLVTCAVCSK